MKGDRLEAGGVIESLALSGDCALVALGVVANSEDSYAPNSEVETEF